MKGKKALQKVVTLQLNLAGQVEFCQGKEGNNSIPKRELDEKCKSACTKVHDVFKELEYKLCLF